MSTRRYSNTNERRLLAQHERQCQPTYKPVGGECYGHGISGGERVHIAEQEDILPTKICLCEGGSGNRER